MNNSRLNKKKERKLREIEEGNAEIISVSSYSTNYSPIINNSKLKNQ